MESLQVAYGPWSETNAHLLAIGLRPWS